MVPLWCCLKGLLLNTEFRHCQIVVLKPKQTIWGAIKFVDVKIYGGTFSNVTLLMSTHDYSALDAEMKANIPVLHEIA
jgi:hypothetical protein